MNLHVDLILDTEQRSASVFSLKSLARLGTIGGPILAVLLIAGAVFSFLRLKGEVDDLEDRWKLAEPRKLASLRYRQQLSANKKILDELEGWQAAQLAWHRQLIAVQREIPDTVQLHRMSVNQTLQFLNKRTPARSFVMVLEGRAIGETAETDIQDLKRRMGRAEPFVDTVKEDGVHVPVYGSDPTPGANKADRIFKIQCLYIDKLFEKPRKARKQA
ncbi:MAG: hypothetical protein HQ559_05140 [Lentisphaerae bacterium]|nr:hypothetical protein [Lentisphaerota bacterium]